MKYGHRVKTGAYYNQDKTYAILKIIFNKKVLCLLIEDCYANKNAKFEYLGFTDGGTSPHISSKCYREFSKLSTGYCGKLYKFNNIYDFYKEALRIENKSSKKKKDDEPVIHTGKKVTLTLDNLKESIDVIR